MQYLYFVLAAVEVSERPKFTMPLSNVMARAGQKFKLECHVSGLPSPTVTWFHNSKPVKETPDCKVTDKWKIYCDLQASVFAIKSIHEGFTAI